MSAELVDTYGQALCRGDVARLVDVLAADAVSQSPFRIWHGPALRRVYTARAAVSLGDGAIVRVDAFLRPADVLGSVYQAMVRSRPDR